MKRLTLQKHNLARNWSCLGWLVLCCLLALGQLQRWQLGLNVAIYAHEVWLAIWLGGVCLLQPKLMLGVQSSARALWRRYLPWSDGIMVGLATGWLVAVLHGHSLLIPLLYVLRLLAYGMVLLFVKEMVRQESLRVKEIAVGVLGWGILLLYFGFLQYVFMPDMRWLYFLGWDDHYYRLISTLFDPGFTGLLLVFTFCLVQWWPATWLPAKLRQSAKMFTSLLLEVGILLTYSRASYGALTIALVAVGGWHVYQRRKISLRARLWGLSLVYVLVFVAGLGLLPHPGGEGVQLGRTSTVVARQENIQVAIASLQPTDWITGKGLFVPLSKQSAQGTPSAQTQTPADLPLPSHAQVPDNWAVMALASGGIILLVSLAGFLLLLLQRWWKVSPWLGSALLAILFHGLFNASIIYPFAWLFLGFFAIVANGNSSTHREIKSTQ